MNQKKNRKLKRSTHTKALQKNGTPPAPSKFNTNSPCEVTETQ